MRGTARYSQPRHRADTARAPSAEDKHLVAGQRVAAAWGQGHCGAPAETQEWGRAPRQEGYSCSTWEEAVLRGRRPAGGPDYDYDCSFPCWEPQGTSG